MLQAGRSRVQVSMRSLDSFSIVLILPAELWTLGSTQPLTEINTRNLPGSKGRPVRKADNLATIYEPIVGTSTSHNPMGLQGLLQGYRDTVAFTFYLK
jgi:hypothetical protein